MCLSAVTWHLPRVVMLPQYSDPLFLCLIPSFSLAYWVLRYKQYHTTMGWYWWARQGWVTLAKLGDWIQSWVILMCVWATFLHKFSQQVHPVFREQTSSSRDYHSLCLYSSRHMPNVLSLMKVSKCSCTINNNLNIVCLSSSCWGWSDHFGKMEQLSSKNTYLKNYSGRSETYKLINGLKLGWRLWWEETFSSQKEKKL